jgi:hypothetical protein
MTNRGLNEIAVEREMARRVYHGLGMCNTVGRDVMGQALLDVEYARAREDYERLEKEYREAVEREARGCERYQRG